MPFKITDFFPRKSASTFGPLSFGFFASADSQTIFEGYNRLGKFTRLVNTRLGRCSYIAESTKINNTSVGRFSSIGPGCMIGGLARHPTNWLSTHPAFYSDRGQAGLSFVAKTLFDEASEVAIGHDCWIGARVTVVDGVTIGDGAIIAAGALVAKDVAPYTIVGGVPAKKISDRFPKDVAKKIQRFAWWNKDLDELEGLSSKLFSTALNEDILSLVEEDTL